MENMGNTPSAEEVLNSSANRSTVNISTQSNSEIASALGSLLLYSAAMFILPIGTFYGVRHVLLNELDVRGFANTCWSVGAAVVVVNLIIALYAIKAFREEEKTVPPKNVKVN